MISHILCPTDLKERAYISLTKAVQIAHQFNARITMLNVHREFMDKHERKMLRVSVDKLKEKYRQVAIESREEMKTVIHELHADDIEITYLLREGKPADTIIEVSAEEGVDLIVICTDGRDNLKEIKMQLKNFLAERIIRCLLFFSMVLVTCQSLQTTVAAKDLIPLQKGGPHAGSWESSDVFLEYQYVSQQNTFKLNIGGKAKRKYDQLSVWIKFIDAQGKVLEKKSVFNSGFRRKLPRGKDSIEKTFEIPINSTQFTFHSMLKERLGR